MDVSRPHRLLVVAACALALGACRDSTDPAKPPAVRLQVGALPDTIGLGDTFAMAAQVLDAQGEPVRDATIAWSSNAPARIEVSAEGYVRALAVGDAWLVARALVGGKVVARDSVHTLSARLPRGVVVSAPRDSLVVGDTMTLVAHVVDGLGVPFADRPVRYRAVDSLVVVVDSLTGFARVIADGDTRVVATGAGREGSLVLHGWLRQLETGGVRLAQIDLGWNFGCGLDAEGAAWCWGMDARGQLGRGGRASGGELAFGPVNTTSRFTSIGAGRGAACGVTVDAAAECWGDIRGDWYTSAEQRGMPTRLPLPDSVPGVRSVHMGDNDGHCIIDLGGVGYCFGVNGYGQIGARDSLGIDVGHPRALPGTPGSLRALQPGSTHGCAVRYARVGVYCWSAAGDPLPTLVEGAPASTEIALGISTSCALDGVGATWCWGLLTSSVASAPTRISTVAFRHLEASIHNACGIADTGEIFCWGLFGTGEGTVSPGLAARPFSRRLRFVDMAVGPDAVCGLTADGAVFCREGTPAFSLQ